MKSSSTLYSNANSLSNSLYVWKLLVRILNSTLAQFSQFNTGPILSAEELDILELRYIAVARTAQKIPLLFPE
jgi:hypothetical protein